MKKQLITAALTTLLTLILTACSYADGEKVGSIVKIAKEGVIFKTNEVELIRGGLDDGTGVIGTPFYSTIDNPALLPIAYQALEENKEVKIKYHSNYFAPFSSGNRENNFVDSIEIIYKGNKECVTKILRKNRKLR
jgi:hypothetical protein